MSRHGPWAVLKIARTNDRGEIKRAYAKLLRVTNPEDDAAGFERLRAAYESALQHVRWEEERKAHAAQHGYELEIHDDEDEDADGEEGDALSEPGSVLVLRPGSVRLLSDDEGARPPAEPAAEPEPRTRSRPATEEERFQAEPAADPPPRPRVRVRASEEMDLAPPPPELQEMAREEQEHIAKLQWLSDLVADDNGGSQARIDALEAVLKSPAMDMVVVSERTEHFLGNLIAHNPRRTDEMVDRVIEYFGWDAARVGAWRPVAEAALRRREEIIQLGWMRKPGSVNHGPFMALSRKPTPWRKVLNRLAFGRGVEVRNFLWNIHEQFPGLRSELNDEAIAWWEDQLSRPRIGPAALWAIIASLPVFAVALLWWMAGVEEMVLGTALFATMPLGLATLLIAKHYAVDVARDVIGRKFNYAYPDWMRFGWAPVSLVPVLLAALIPASTPAMIAVAVLAFIPLLWSLICAEPDREHEDGADWGAWGYMSLLTIPFYLTQWIWRPNMHYAWRTRTIFTFGFLGVFYAVVLQDMDPAEWTQMLVPVAAASYAVSFGLGSLIDAWRDEHRRLARTLINGGALVCGLAGFGLALAGPATVFGPASIALLLVPVLVHKVPVKDMGEGPRMFRDAITRYGFMLWIIFGGIMTAVESVASPVFRVAAPWLITGPVAILIVSLWREWVPTKRKPARARWEA